MKTSYLVKNYKGSYSGFVNVESYLLAGGKLTVNIPDDYYFHTISQDWDTGILHYLATNNVTFNVNAGYLIVDAKEIEQHLDLFKEDFLDGEQ